MKMKIRDINVIVLLVLLIFSGCAKKDEERVISRHPTGEVKETAVYGGEGEDEELVKSYEYYHNGNKKKEYHYLNSQYFGDWTYWYRNGSIMAEGRYDEKTLDPSSGTGSATYYWRDGKKMMDITSGRKEAGKRESTVIYYDEDGRPFTDDNIPPELTSKIRTTIQRWTKGGI
jgi:antitoxin component YwqK of YwqJK toxin-antitoxin module